MELPRIYLRGNNCKKWQGIAQNVLLQSKFTQEFDVKSELSLEIDDRLSEFTEFEEKAIFISPQKIEVVKKILFKRRIESPDPDLRILNNLKQQQKISDRNAIVDGFQNTQFGTFRRQSCFCKHCGPVSAKQSKFDQQQPKQIISMHQKEEQVEKVIICIEKQQNMINTYDLRDALNREKLKKVLSENEIIMQDFCSEFGDHVTKKQRGSVIKSNSNLSDEQIQTFQIKEHIQKSKDIQELIEQNELDGVQKPTYLKLMSAKHKLMMFKQPSSIKQSQDGGSIRLQPIDSAGLQQNSFKKKQSTFHIHDNQWVQKNMNSVSSNKSITLSQVSLIPSQPSSVNIKMKKKIKHEVYSMKTQYLNVYNKNQIISDFVEKYPIKEKVKLHYSHSLGQLSSILKPKMNSQERVEGQIIKTYLNYNYPNKVQPSYSIQKRSTSFKSSCYFEAPPINSKMSGFDRQFYHRSTSQFQQ